MIFNEQPYLQNKYDQLYLIFHKDTIKNRIRGIRFFGGKHQNMSASKDLIIHKVKPFKNGLNSYHQLFTKSLQCQSGKKLKS